MSHSGRARSASPTPDYFRELDFIAGAYSYSLICFNNGLHSLVTDRGEWVAAYRAAVDFLRAKLPDAKLLLLLCTALNDPVRNEIVKRINSDILKTAEEKSLATLDLFTPTDSLDKDKMMGRHLPLQACRGDNAG